MLAPSATTESRVKTAPSPAHLLRSFLIKHPSIREPHQSNKGFNQRSTGIGVSRFSCPPPIVQ